MAVIVIFGGTGDLAKRKLIPSLVSAHKNGDLENTHVVAFGRRDYTDETYAQYVESFVLNHIDEEKWKAFTPNLHYFRGNFDEPESFAYLRDYLDAFGEVSKERLFYLATAPENFSHLLQLMHEHDLMHEKENGWTRLIVEKPFGNDLNSAQSLNALLHKYLQEDQIFRIDHYLAKELVQNILVFRFANSIFEDLWNQKHIEHVQITVSEDLGVESRAGYYDKAGALKDMIQNHLLQILALIAMEPPVSLSAQHIRDEKVKVFRALDLRSPEHVLRAQYEADHEKGIPGYRQESGISEHSTTETFVDLKVYVNNWRWSDVPFYLRTGKRLKKKSAEVTLFFRRSPPVLFSKYNRTQHFQNKITFKIQPEEGVVLDFNMKEIDGPTIFDNVKMEYCHSCKVDYNTKEAYERLLLDAMKGDHTLFTRADGVESAWEFIDKVYAAMIQQPLYMYEPGSWGPHESDVFLATKGRAWKNP